METFNNCTDLLRSLQGKPITAEIQNALIKAFAVLRNPDYKTIMVSVSGGADSDIMIDMIERVGHPFSDVRYVFFDTGIEFSATKKHLEYLESKYGIKIDRYRAKAPVPIACEKYGLPFLSKQVSEYISRLQNHGFKWENKPFNELYAEYPHCKAALRWWCNEWGEGSQIGIKRNKWLKEFMIQNPPDFMISDKCCQCAKKNTAKDVQAIVKADVSCVGIRKAEGGARSTAYKNCFDDVPFGTSVYRPLFWFKKEDRDTYEASFDVSHSDCYTLYGLKRTGCACCPFGRNFEYELFVAEKYEPNLFRAANHVFGKSFDYTRKYREFCKKMEDDK